MSEQAKDRPFAIGDFVIIKIGDHKSFTKTICDVDLPIVYCELNGSRQGYHEDYIKHIRKPRKGGKEARRIVHMLCKEYCADMRWLLFCIKRRYDNQEDLNEYWVNRKNKDTSYISERLYLKAKRMLGGSDDN